MTFNITKLGRGRLIRRCPKCSAKRTEGEKDAEEIKRSKTGDSTTGGAIIPPDKKGGTTTSAPGSDGELARKAIPPSGTRVSDDEAELDLEDDDMLEEDKAYTAKKEKPGADAKTTPIRAKIPVPGGPADPSRQPARAPGEVAVVVKRAQRGGTGCA